LNPHFGHCTVAMAGGCLGRFGGGCSSTSVAKAETLPAQRNNSVLSQ